MLKVKGYTLTGTSRSRVKGQYLSEYAIVFSLVLAALIGMQVYVKRGLQGRYRDIADTVVLSLREQTGKDDLSLQYEPYYIESNITTASGTAASPNIAAVTVEAGETNIEMSRTSAIEPNAETGEFSYRKTLSVAGAD